MKFAVVDIETTGLNPEHDRIIEIGVVLMEYDRVCSEHQFLIQPEQKLRPVIVHLTGISDRDLEGMPLFEEVADELLELLSDRVLIGHNIQFDYSFLKKAFAGSGISFSSKTICTRDLSEFVFPGLRSFSLKSICRKLKIANEKPHRALPDARVTALLFHQLSVKAGESFINEIVSGKGNKTLIPAHLRPLISNQLPETPGVYYFMGSRNKPVYIGKAVNIRQRVISHFRGDGNSLKILAFAAGIRNIVFQETGSELLACLLEDHEIRHYWPSRNHAQKRNRVRFGIEYYTDQSGNLRLSITRSVRPRCSLFTFHQYFLAADFLRRLVLQYELNGPLCGIPDLNTGIVTGLHQLNMQTMLHHETGSKKISIFFVDDLNLNYKGFIWLENGFYKGFGRIPDELKMRKDEIQKRLVLRFSSVTTEGIISKLKGERQPDLEFISGPEQEDSITIFDDLQSDRS